MENISFSVRPSAWSHARKAFNYSALLFLLFLTTITFAEGKRTVRARVMPVYPEIAKRMRIFGLVKLEATVDPEGKVTAVKAIDGNQMLVLAAEEALKRTKFEPGDSVTTEQVEVNFPRIN